MSYSIEGNLNVVTINNSSYTVNKDPVGTVFFINASQITTINLPSVNSVPKGTHYIFKRDGGSYNVVIDPNSSETIDGASTKSISGFWDSWRIVSTGSAWISISLGLS